MSNSLRVVYMGTPDFAVEPLRQLLEAGVNIVGVVTVPDKPAGRGQKMQQSPVKQFAEHYNIPLLQPERLRDDTFLNALHNWQADLFIVVAFRMLPEVVWTMPAKGTINLHASLLPQYRSAAPINWAIINGETVTGVTTFFISHEIDTGNLLLQDKVLIDENETAGELHDKLMYVGAKLLVCTVEKIGQGSEQGTPQPHIDDLKQAPKIFKETCQISWNKNVDCIHNFIRGLSPYPTAWGELVSPNPPNEAIKVKIYKSSAKVENHQLKPGIIVSDGKTFIKVACNNGYIFIHELQLAGKKRLTVSEFLLGFRHVDNFSFI